MTLLPLLAASPRRLPTAVFGDGNRPITFMYAAYPWEVASIARLPAGLMELP